MLLNTIKRLPMLKHNCKRLLLLRNTSKRLLIKQNYKDVCFEGEKNYKKGGLNCVFGNFFFYVLDNCPQVQSLK